MAPKDKDKDTPTPDDWRCPYCGGDRWTPNPCVGDFMDEEAREKARREHERRESETPDVVE